MLIFDFDGVLIDSVLEVVVSTYNAASKSRCVSLEEVPNPYRELFCRYRPYAQTAGDNLALARWCLEVFNQNPLPSLSREEFARVLAEQKDSGKDRGEEFFRVRTWLQENHLEQWVDLNVPYQPLWKTLSAHPAETVRIVTYKNSAAVLALCRAFGIDIPANNIFAGDAGTKKADHFCNLLKQHAQQSLLFIDDNIANLSELVSLRSKAFQFFLADWGYVLPNDKERAANLKIPTLNQRQLCAALQTLSPDRISSLS